MTVVDKRCEYMQWPPIDSRHETEVEGVEEGKNTNLFTSVEPRTLSQGSNHTDSYSIY